MQISVGRANVAQVDEEDYEDLVQYNWQKLSSGSRTVDYAYCPKLKMYMHVYLVGYRGVDHIDHDGLNNRRSNLRDGRGPGNARNTRKRTGGSSQYKGVCLYHRQGRQDRWQAWICVEGRQMYLGSSFDELKMAMLYDVAASRYFGEYAVLNFPIGV